MKTSIRNWLVVITTMLLATITSFAGNFTKGNLAVLRMGQASETLGSGGNSIFIDEYTPSGTLVQSIAIPNTGSSALVLSGAGTTEGILTLSPDSKLLCFAAYNTNIASGTANVSSASGATEWRAVATVNQGGSYNLVSTTSSLSAARGACTDGAGNYWAAGSANSILYFSTISGPGVAGGAQTTIGGQANSRVPDIFNGQLYYGTGSGSGGSGSAGVSKVGTGLPTTSGQTATVVVTGSTSTGDFAFKPDGTVLYQANDTTGINKWTFDGTSWSLAYTLAQACRGLTVDWSGTDPVIYGTDAGSGSTSHVFVLTDTGSGSTGTSIVTGNSGYLYRGIRFAPAGAPVITTQPAGQTVTAGNNASYSVALAAGTSTTSLTYIWKDNLGNSLATDTPGTLTDSFTFSNAQLSDSGKTIHVEISNDLGTANSGNADLIVNPSGLPPSIDFPVFADQDPIYAGQTVVFEVDVTGTTPMTYSWSLNGTPLSNGGNISIVDNGLSSKVTFTGITAGQAGTIYCGITNGVGGTSSSLAYTVTIPTAPSVSAMNPTGSITNNAGASRTITVGASSQSGVLSYQWMRGATSLSNGAHVNGATVSGATTSALQLTGVLGGDDGTYHCVVSNAGGNTDSSPTYEAYLTVIDPIVTSQPVSRIVVAGNTLNVSVGATGTGMTFQWSKDGNPLSDGGNVSGATTSALAITGAQASDAGVYSVDVNSAFGSVSTTPATIIVASTTPQPIAATNIVVLQRGDGVESLSGNGNTLYLLQYTPSGSLVSCYQVPNSGVNSLIQAGNTPTEGWLTKAGDGQSLVFGGYATALAGASGLAASSGSTVNRGVGTIDAAGNYILAAKGTNHSTGNIRSATGDGLGNFWTAGSKGGLGVYTLANPAGSTVWTNIGNLRVINNFNGNLYLGSSTVQKLDGNVASSGADGVYAFSGFPTTFQTSPNTNEWYITIQTNSVDVGIYDFAINPADNIAYITDDQGFSAPDIGGIHRWDKVGGVWTYSYRIGQSSRGLTVDWSGVNPIIYATTPIGNSTNGDNFVHGANNVVKVVDTGANSAITTIATAVGGSMAGIRTAPGVSQTITFPTIADAYSCSTPIALGATASSGLSVTYSIDAGPATISGGNVVITTPIASPVTVTVRASQSGNATYSPAMDVTRSFTVNPSTFSGVNLAGLNPTDLCQGGNYVEAGASAQDSCGNVISATISGGPVDVNTLGSYTLTYSVSDATSGATASATRVVNVLDCGITIVTQPQSQSRQPQGTNVTLSVVATSGQPLSYQWFENGSPVAGANGSVYSFQAHPVTSSNVNYYVEISNASTTNQSATALVTVIVDTKDPTITKISSPLANTRAQSFTISGIAKDVTGGNVSSVVWQWDNANGAETIRVTNDLSTVTPGPLERDFSFPNQVPAPGTNQLTVWVYDLAGRVSKPKVVKGLFLQKPHIHTIAIGGDGSGSLLVKTKGAGGETVPGAPTSTLVNGSNVTLTVYEYQTYTLKFTADKKKDVPTVGLSVASVVSNVVGQTVGTSSTKPVTYFFQADNSDPTDNVYFSRNRFVDMAGQYNGVFTADVNAPSKENSRYFTMNVSKARTVSGKLIDSAKLPTTFTGTFAADGSITIVANTITIQGNLAWTGSEDPNGVKQFVGSATDGSWTAPLVADKVDTTALADGLATMSIPPTNSVPGGSGGIYVKAKNGGLNFSALLADDDKHANVVTGKASRSGNVPLWIITHFGGLFFGTVNASNSLANLSATQLSWIRPPGNTFYPSLTPAGFTNSPIVATCSPYDIANASFTGTFHVTTLGSASSNLDQVVSFASGKATASGQVTAGSLANGVLKITFLDGGPSKHKTTAVGYYLENATNGAGFYIQAGAAAAGSLSLTPVPTP